MYIRHSNFSVPMRSGRYKTSHASRYNVKIAVSPNCIRKGSDSPIATRDGKAAQTTGSLKHNKSETHNDDERSVNSEHPVARSTHAWGITDLVQKRVNQMRQQSPKGMEHRGMRPSDSPLLRKITTL